MAQRCGHGIPAKAVQVHADAIVHGGLRAGDHVSIAADQNEIGELVLHSGHDHIGHEPSVDAFLGASLTPFNELPCAQLHALAGAKGALVAVWTGIRDSVVPVLALNRVA